MEEKRWPENIKNWHKISEKTAELAIMQSETFLKETMSTAQSIRDRADKLLTILIPSVSALIFYIISEGNKLTIILHLTAIISLIVLLLSLRYVFFNIKAYSIRTPGNNAESFINNYLIAEDDSEKDQYIQIALQISKEYNNRGEANKRHNEKHSKYNQIALKILVFGLISAPVLAIILNLFYANCFLLAPCQ